MKLTLKPVTEKNRNAVLAVRTAAGQETFIETVAQCLLEADEDPVWHPLEIRDGDLTVGFAMYGLFLQEYPPRGRLWLDRLVIDRDFQGKGIGRASMEALLKLLEADFPKRDVYLSVVGGNAAAVHLYEDFGFRFTGEKDIHGEDVMVRKYQEDKRCGLA